MKLVAVCTLVHNSHTNVEHRVLPFHTDTHRLRNERRWHLSTHRGIYAIQIIRVDRRICRPVLVSTSSEWLKTGLTDVKRGVVCLQLFPGRRR